MKPELKILDLEEPRRGLLSPTSSTAADARLWHPPQVLVVDDDVDAALLVERIFSHLGCETTCSLNSSEARRKICARKSDIIVLDWCLEQHIDASSVLNQCMRTFARFGEKARRPRLITYSSLTAAEIDLAANPYFEYLGHWQKPVAHGDLLRRALALLKNIEH